MSLNDDQQETLRERAERELGERAEPWSKMPSQDIDAMIADLINKRHELQVHQIELELQNEQLAQANLELDAARDEYRELFDHAPIGYLTFDQNGIIGRANLTLGGMLGVARERLPGRRFTAYVHPDDVTSFALFLRRVFADSGRRTLEVRLVRPGGTFFHAQLEGSVPREGPGAALQCRLAVTDITAQRQAQEEVMRLNATLEARVAARTKHVRELSEELETFVYAVTHDLLTPLRHIRGFTGLLGRGGGASGAAGERYVQHIEHSVDRMEQLLRALLAFFRTGQQRIRFQEVDLGRVLTEVKKDLGAEMEGREVTLTHDALPVVQGDSLALQLAFANLLSNALKFTRGKTPARIHVCAQENEREYVVCVEDNGAGFNMRQKERLFGVFQRLHSERDFEGNGVGLALVRRIVHRHGGRVWAEGKPGQGATFSFSLPKGHEEIE